MSTNPKAAKVLIVEDDALIAMSLREVLLLGGFEVVGVAPTVSDALRLAQTRQPDVAIFDVGLPGKRDGIEGAGDLGRMLHIPVVFLTAQVDEGTRARARAVNAAGFLSKPVHSNQIIAALTNALGQSDSRFDERAAREPSS